MTTTGCVWCGKTLYKGAAKETDQGRMCGQCDAAYRTVQNRTMVKG